MRHGLGRVLAVSAALLSPVGLLLLAAAAPALAVGAVAVGVAAGVARLRGKRPSLGRSARRRRPAPDAAGVDCGC